MCYSYYSMLCFKRNIPSARDKRNSRSLSSSLNAAHVAEIFSSAAESSHASRHTHQLFQASVVGRVQVYVWRRPTTPLVRLWRVRWCFLCDVLYGVLLKFLTVWHFVLRVILLQHSACEELFCNTSMTSHLFILTNCSKSRNTLTHLRNT